VSKFADSEGIQISPVFEAERHKLLVEWNGTKREYPRDKCIHQLFEQQVERTPEAVAVVFEKTSLTYRELNARANQLAHRLRALGVGPEMLVAICVERSLEMIVGLLGILKAGGAYVPIDPAYPADRVAFMQADANAPVILTQKALREKLPSTAAKVIFLDSDWKTIQQESDRAPVTGVTADHLAYVIYTSGSTGRPKGVLITHHNVTRLMQATADWFHFGERDVWTMFHSYAFDFSVWEMWGALLHGGRLVVVSYFVSRCPEAFLKLLAEESITVLNQTPSAFSQLIQAESATGSPPELALRYLIFGGEALQPQSLKPWFERHGDAHPQLVNMYGITETTVHVTYRPLTKHDVQSPMLIGVPISDLQVYVLDSHGKPSPIGVPGEMFVGGAGLARGYHNQPELTAERFVADPFSSEPGARLYRTGDLARWRSDGILEFLGRADLQVKVRGFRVELGEIEAGLDAHPAVSASAVSAQGDGIEKIIVAYVVSRSGVELSVPSLRAWLEARLPEYMVPARFVQVAVLPINANGKLDRKALTKIDGRELAAGMVYVAPRIALEEQLAGIWQTVLRQKLVGVHDNFFHLGGHSLLAVILCSQINRQLGLEVSLRQVFEHPTIERLAGQLAALKDNPSNQPVIERVDRRQPLPLSYGQQGMWLLQQTLPDSAAYNQPLAWLFTGQVDEARLRQALQILMDRHEMLRTALVQTGEALVQKILPAGELQVCWQTIDLSGIPTGQRQDALETRLLAEARQVFDLAQAPLWRVAWVRLAAEEQVLATTFHHSIVDEWSLRHFCSELADLYELLGYGHPTQLPALTVHYADYAAWQRQRLCGTLLESQQAYWREQLRDLPSALQLPVDRHRPPRASGRGAVHAFRLKAATVSGVRNLAKAESTTLFTVMLTAYHIWLQRYTGQPDIIVGTPLAQRELPEVESVFGYFLNTLPIRAKLEGKHSFREALHQVRTTVLEGLKHAELPFELMVELAISRREAGLQPLYQTMFVLVEEGVTALSLGAAQGRPLALHTKTSKNDLLLSVLAEGEEWQCEFEYATDLFEARTVERMAGHWQALLASISENPECPIRQLNMLPAPEHHQILVEWNATERQYPRNKCVHQLFEEQVERTPEAVAVVFEENALTYHELNQRANQLAHHLRQRGVGPDHLVVVFLDRSLEMVVTILGILKAGGAYVPLDPALPQQRQAVLLAETKSQLAVTRKTLAAQFQTGLEASGAAGQWVILESIFGESAHETERQNPAAVAAPNHLAYVLFTSGSTGQPKGVQMPHQALVNLLTWQSKVSRMGVGHRTLQFASLGFDVSFQEIFSTLVTGGTLLLISDEVRANPRELLSAISATDINRVFLPYVMLEQIAGSWAGQKLACLQEVAVAGEQLRVSPGLRNFFNHLPNCRFWNHYGPTETHVATSWELIGAPADWPDLPSIGRPLPNCQVYLLDEDLNPTPLGLAGGLYLGGDCLARGYLHQPELTAERFIPNPFRRTPGAKLYQTGDLARWRPEGDLEYLGRVDFQIKVRGFRIELGEIEMALNAHPAVRTSAASAQGDGIDKIIVAYVVSRSGHELSAPSLRTWLEARLPNYMVPARFVQVAALPINANGKLDRKALAKMDGRELAAGMAYVAPRNAVEEQLAGIWQTVLRQKQVGVHDNFFHLGGHSLLAVILCSQINRQLGLEVSLRQVFEHPTIERLGKQIEALEGCSPINSAIQKTDRHQPLPMSFGQQAMWLLQQTLPDPTAYNLPVAWRFQGQMDRAKVRRALTEIQSRHEVLRTALVQASGNLSQLIRAGSAVPLPWQEVDLRSLPLEQKPAALEDGLRKEARHAFDLAQAPLWQVTWIDLADEDQVLLFCFHHSIVDEWSLRLFFQELELLYAANGPAHLAPLPELPVQYADYAAWQRQRLTGQPLETLREYWRGQLQELPPALELPLALPRPAQPSGRGAAHQFALSGPLVARFRELAREEDTTLFSVVLAAFQVWLHRSSGQNDIVVGTPITGRERPEVQSLLGLFLNTLPIRVRLEGRQSFREVVRQVRTTLLAAFSHAGLPFEQMVELAIKERAPAQSPLFQAMFVLLEQGLPDFQLAQVQGRPVPVEPGTSKRDLTLSIEAARDDWQCHLEYATDLFTADCAARMAGHLGEVFRSIAGDPEQPLRQLQLMPEGERHQILVNWNQTERHYPVDKCVHQLFEEQVERTPEAVAVVFGENSLTYRELNLRANQLAHHLRSLAVGPDVLVGLCLERSLEMVVALLGILKAGGAYVPFDHKWPPDRARLVLEDAHLAALVTRRTYADRLPSGTLPLVLMDDPPLPPDAQATDNPVPSSSPKNLVYVLYTSGTSGLPKGVLLEHRQLLNYIWAVAERLDLDATGRYAMLQPLTVDSCQTMIFPALARGGTLHLIDEERALDARSLADYMVQQRIDYLKIAPTHLAALLDQLPSAALLPARTLIIGGEASHWDFIDRLWSLTPRCAVWNHYGPTETTVGVSVCQLNPADARDSLTVPIGRPLPNVKYYVVDQDLQPVPLGWPGELCIGGEQVARGYLDRAELTASRFAPDPFGARPNARLYRSGDTVRYLADGRVEFLGRQDQQVKIRGFRIELGEIEAALHATEGVRDAVVTVDGPTTGEKRLKAFVVADGNMPLDDVGFRARLAARLPDYMIPSRFVLLPNLPRTPHGKVDRKALEHSTGVELTSSEGAAAPRTELESKLVEIWQAVLHRESVGIRDNFFHLGGSSLVAVAVQARVEKELGRRLPLAAFFQAPTVQNLAQLLADPSAPACGVYLTECHASPDKPPLFCLHHLSAAQRLAKHLAPHWPVYGVESPLDEELRKWHTRRELDLTLEELAARNVAILQRVQPHGPYYLAGFCFGGVLAFEVARQLESQGERVALLALMDANHLPGLKKLAFPGLRRWAYHARRAVKEGPGYVLKKLRSKSEIEQRRTSALKKLLSEGGVATRTETAETRWPRAEFLGQLRQAYQGKPYAGNALLFRTVEEPKSFAFDFGPTSGWDQVILGEIQIEDLECGHMDLSEEPYVGEVARKLAHHLLNRGGQSKTI